MAILFLYAQLYNKKNALSNFIKALLCYTKHRRISLKISPEWDKLGTYYVALRLRHKSMLTCKIAGVISVMKVLHLR